MKLSIAVCTHNEGYYVRDLLNRLVPLVAREPDAYELVIIDDFSTEKETERAINDVAHVVPGVHCHSHHLNGDFATHKNFMNSKCSGEFILNLDADESLDIDLLTRLPLIIQSNPMIDAYWFPRVNTVSGLTLAHVQKWGWVITAHQDLTAESRNAITPEHYALLAAYNLIENEEENGWLYYHAPMIQWPDPQMRLYRNDPSIRWVGKVHERLEGFTHYTHFPMTVDYAIQHDKEIARQEQQNSYYETIT